jgi:glycosyltransferase involved in cell wall biosynthesis
MLRCFIVVIPARNEAPTIGPCLESVLRAARAARPIATRVVVVCDSSSDDTEPAALELLAGSPSMVLTAECSNAGTARALGFDVALAMYGGESSSLWLASTDADSVVPEDWLSKQSSWAEQGVAGVAGIVRLPEHERARHRAYEEFYDSGIEAGGHSHVHGANLGVRADWYVKCGGFARVAVGEDVALWSTLKAAGAPLVADPGLIVTTSGRVQSRVLGGHASVLEHFLRAT